MEPIRFVCATRHGPDEFATATMLGRMLERYKLYYDVQLALVPNNTKGLPQVYNAEIEKALNDDVILVFIHDDMCLTDFYWQDTLREAMRRYDLAGLVGNRRRQPMQPSWSFQAVDGHFAWDDRENLSGAMGYGEEFPCHIGYFGPPWQECKLLDGVFLAARSATLRDQNVRFDERYDFHFYDMDFCREIEAKGLTTGVCSISAIHGSPGGFGASWLEAYQTYINKWGG